MTKKLLLSRFFFAWDSCTFIAQRPASSFSVSRTKQTFVEANQNVLKENELVIYNSKRNIDARPRKLNLLAKQIRLLPLSQAIDQMEFSAKKAGEYIKKVLIETQEKAKKEHGITDMSSLWVAESYVGRGFIEKSVIRHGRGRYGQGRKAYTHYFVVVKEGLPKPRNQRRTHEEKTDFQRYIEYKPKILDSHASW